MGRVRGGPLGGSEIAGAPATLETILQHSQGRNPDEVDYRFSLERGRRHTAKPPLIAAIRELLDRETEQRAREADLPS